MVPGVPGLPGRTVMAVRGPRGVSAIVTAPLPGLGVCPATERASRAAAATTTSPSAQVGILWDGIVMGRRVCLLVPVALMKICWSKYLVV